MFAKNSKAYSVYLLFRFVSSLAVSMSTVLSIVYHLEVVQLDAFQLVLVGTVGRFWRPPAFCSRYPPVWCRICIAVGARC